VTYRASAGSGDQHPSGGQDVINGIAVSTF